MEKVTFSVSVDHPRWMWALAHVVRLVPGLTSEQRRRLAYKLFDMARIHLVIDGKVIYRSKWSE